MVWIGVASLCLLCIAGYQFGSVGLITTRIATIVRRRRQANLSELRQAAEITRLSCEIQASKQNGMGWRVMEVAEVQEESEDCKSFYLVDPYGEPLPDFRPGQYLMVRPALAGAYQTTRCYSLSSAPNERFWRITVKRQESGDDQGRQPKNGGLSKWLHSTISPGDCLLIGGPSGQFFLPKENTSPLVLMAAGVGITPMASMLRWSLEATPDRKVVLLYQAKNLEHWPLGECLHSWQADFPNIRLVTFCSRASDADLAGAKIKHPGIFVKGKFDFTDALRVMDSGDCDYFMCGPDPWMQAIRDGLVENGVDGERVHWESFGGTGAQPKAASEGSAEAVAVRFEHSDVDAEWSDPEQTLWELARESDVELPSGCLSGVCGCCRVKLLKGKVEYDREVSIELAEDECLTCVTRPKTEVVLDA